MSLNSTLLQLDIVSKCNRYQGMLISIRSELHASLFALQVHVVASLRRPPPGYLTAAWLAQLVGRQSAVREVEGSSPRPDQHSGS